MNAPDNITDSPIIVYYKHLSQEKYYSLKKVNINCLNILGL